MRFQFSKRVCTLNGRHLLLAVVPWFLNSGTALALQATRDIPCPNGELLRVSGQVELHPACSYSGGILIKDSDTTLDCRGALIKNTDGNGFGVHLFAPPDRPLER